MIPATGEGGGAGQVGGGVQQGTRVRDGGGGTGTATCAVRVNFTALEPSVSRGDVGIIFSAARGTRGSAAACDARLHATATPPWHAPLHRVHPRDFSFCFDDLSSLSSSLRQLCG